MEKIKLGLPGRDEGIEIVCRLLKSMGALGIPVRCSMWMPILGVLRTSRTIPTRGDALVIGGAQSGILKKVVVVSGYTLKGNQAGGDLVRIRRSSWYRQRSCLL